MKAAVYCGTRNLYADMLPALKSLLEHSDVDRVYLLIEDDEFPYELPECVECINVSGQPWFDPAGPNYYCRWTYMVLMRAALHNVFPELDKIVSLDVDTVVVRDISMLWDIDIRRFYLAGVREPFKSRGGVYINAGVMLLNLAKLRDGKGDEIIRLLNTKKYPFPEQDCINERCGKWILELPSEYNACDCTLHVQKPRIVHFAAVKEWRNNPLVEKYRSIPFEGIEGVGEKWGYPKEKNNPL